MPSLFVDLKASAKSAAARRPGLPGQPRGPGVPARARFLVGGLALANLGAWIWAVLAFRHDPALLGFCLVVYGLGLRHAIDADHITAIDNVTRKLMQEEKRPVAVGFFFAIGHSGMVILVTVVVALAAGSLGLFERLQGVGRVVSTVVSTSLLLAIVFMNVDILRKIHRSPRSAHPDAASASPDVSPLVPQGLLSRIFGPVLRLVRQSWHMLPLGFLFGLGFDTATEVAMIGVSTAQVSKGLDLSSVLVFPILFTAGMSLIDTLDGVAMMQAYRWALITPDRRRMYNTAITLTSAVTAGAIAVAQVAALFAGGVQGKGWIQAATQLVQNNINAIGVILLCLFATAWLASYLGAKNVFRPRRPGPHA